MRGDSPIEMTGEAHLVTTSCQECGDSMTVAESAAAEGVSCEVCSRGLSLTVMCRYCNETLPIEMDGDFIEPAWNERHECFGDRTKSLGVIDTDGRMSFWKGDRFEIVVND